MASKTLQEKLKILDKISDAVNDKSGKKVMGRLSKDTEIQDKLRIEYIPTPSQNVNNAIGGGFPRKRMTLVSGNPDSGKMFSHIMQYVYMCKYCRI